MVGRQHLAERIVMKDRFPKPTGGGRRAKLTDVARAANVSLATASRVLNQPGIVTPEVRKRVLDAVRDLAYAPDRTAKALSSGRSFIIGAAVPTLGNAIFADGIEAIQDRLAEHGYTLLLSNSQYNLSKELAQVRAFLDHGVDGLVLVGDRFDPELVRLIGQHDIPAIATYVAASTRGFASVGIDNHAASRELARHLLAAGHREFAVVANTALPNDRSQARLSGILSALEDGELTIDPSRIIEVSKPTISSGRAALQQLLALHPDVTCILCTTDALAVGVLAEARRLGIEVPSELSITGFDDVEIAAETEPALTTIRVPASDIGTIAADQLVRALAGESMPTQTVLPAVLVIRGSTAAAPVARRSFTAR